MTFTLPELPFDVTALMPFCSKETFEYHHGKHHLTYVNKLNDAIKMNPLYENLSLEEVILKAHQENLKAIYNNAAQHFNHSFFWNCLTSQNSQQPSEKLTSLINRDFGSLDKFQELFSSAAATLFGSGWVWLAQGKTGKLEILSLKDADTPLIVNQKPLLTLDVWEHAYYIDHRNVRLNYISEFWKFINWKHLEQQLI